ncbi:nucleotide-binding universal stress UspA family protein [Rhodobacter aestuarii]|uniref:Nucleotide-binding universal stress protein, UspA family n=1 Tax=Rhodobacter aestuarii TaxID=453582 RepID=A0A1N7PK09_9RHOB|nr:MULTISPECIES: universal stress protein [Rhodobacter]PTV94360.1 nucleotide-binding universal stress UspA family protein [Rhodobacter aestuarii]SIT10918.1 Nucleotide-binding universal stress protein, UspA family [Rhodobacter aestuarii]SOC03816.1 nucleotide-binding universal stress UspA family protein [Rhodobacter sp. JA431]
MSGKVIAFVDGSIYATSVCDHAAWIAKRTGAPVVVVHVLRSNGVIPPDVGAPAPLGRRSGVMDELAALDAQRARLMGVQGRALLEDAKTLLEAAGIQDVTTELRQGDLVSIVGDYEPEARGIVLGKRGEEADQAMEHLGANLERISRSCRGPVLVANRAFKPIERILVAHDGGVSALKAVDHIARSPLYTGLTVHLVAVDIDSPAVKKRLSDAQAMLAAAGIVAETTLTQGQPEAVLGRMVDEENYDMLVMGAYGHSRIRSLFIGSTTTATMRACRVPVVLFR